MQPRRVSFTVVVLLLAAMSPIGCGRSACTVSGKVLVNGEPLPSGRIALRPKTTVKNVRTPQAVITDGEYSFSATQGIAPGEYSVVITGRRKTGESLPPEEGSGEVIQRYEQYLPAKYNTSTELTTTLVSNSSEVNFDLELPRAKQR